MKTETKDLKLPNGFEAISNFIEKTSDGNKYYYYNLNICNFEDKDDDAFIRFLPPRKVTLPGGIKCESSAFDLNTAHATQEFMFDTILEKIASDKSKNKKLSYVCYVLDASDSEIEISDFSKKYWGADLDALGLGLGISLETYRYEPEINTFYIYNTKTNI